MKIDEIDTNSEQIREILGKQPNVILKWGITVIFIIVFLMFLTTWFVKYPDIILTEAVITTEVLPQKQYAKITGKIDTIFVKDKQNVDDNQVLAIIENTASFKDVYFLKSIIDTIKLRKNNFYFPINEIPILFLGNIEASYAQFENNYIQYVLNKKLDPFSNERSANEASVIELKKRLSNMKYQQQLNKEELIFKEKDLKRSKHLFEKGVISEREYEAKQLEFIQNKRKYKNITSSISQLRESISDIKRISKKTDVLQIKEEIILLKKVIHSFNLLKKSIKDWEMSYVFNSKMKGKVTFLNYWSKNQTVNQGDLVFTIIPNEDYSFIAKLKTLPQNLGKVKIGQKVNIKLFNYPDYEFGTLKGLIKNISETSNKDGYYIIHASLPNKLITSYNKNIRFRQEMKGRAEIITEDLRLIERLFYQFRRIFIR